MSVPVPTTVCARRRDRARDLVNDDSRSQEVTAPPPVAELSKEWSSPAPDDRAGACSGNDPKAPYAAPLVNKVSHRNTPVHSNRRQNAAKASASQNHAASPAATAT